MMRKKQFFRIIILITSILTVCFTLSAIPKYDSVPGDPLKARIYTLKNGLQVYMTVYKDAPRIQCYIAVKAGSKNDPQETTGLAHYLEHLMFKGTSSFGTTNWKKEKGLLDKITHLFEVYRVETDSVKRAAIYKEIDQISYEASKYAVANEYDKMMSYIGSQGTNAWTSTDNTVYIENIPSNQLENWAIIQAERFKNPILRLFHTELETVYEEKNMTLTNDGRKSSEAMMAGLFPNHPYGQQTTIGEAEHLKNPSIKNIMNFLKNYYVANNMALFISGDFDFDKAIKVIDQYFLILPSGKVPQLKSLSETPITEPVVKEVLGLEAENVRLAFRIDQPANSKEIYILNMMDNMLCNGYCGLIDLNINQKQQIYAAGSYPYILEDNSALVVYGMPKTGQTLSEVRDILLEQINLLKQGKFEDWLLEAAINNMQLSEMRQLESNSARAMWMANAYMDNIPWSEACQSIENYKKITRNDIIQFANKYLNDKNYVVVYKRQEKPEDVAKIEKPAITPIVMNRDVESEFFTKIKAREVQKMQPVYVNFDQDIQKFKYNDCEVLYVKNQENETFNLTLKYDFGRLNDLYIPIVFDYLNYVGTSQYMPEQIKEEFYKLACSFSVNAGEEESNISISGLDKNMDKALTLLMDLLQNPQPNETALQNLITDYLKGREDAKANQGSVLRALRNYGQYGENYIKYQLTQDQLKAITSSYLFDILKRFMKYKPTILFYGTDTPEALTALLERHYKLPKLLITATPKQLFIPLETKTNKVLFAPYDAKQSRCLTYTKGGLYKQELTPFVTMYNNYFSDGMNAIVFQEMREKRSLAYTASARYENPSKPDEYYKNTSFIGTQNDKIIDAFIAFNDLFNNMPTSESAFKLAQESVLTYIETNRITKMNMIWTYLSNMKKNINYDYRKTLYEKIATMTMEDVILFNQTYIKNKPKTYMVLGRENEVDFKTLEAQFGPVTKLTLKDIFGY